jgi:hypothetical protein
MTARQLNHHAMLENVAAFLQLHANYLHNNPAIANITNTLTSDLNNIRELKQVQDKKTKVASMAKDEKKTILTECILKIGAALRAYATEAGDHELLTLTNFTDSKIKRMRHSDLADKAKSIYAASLPLAGKLSIYLVKPEDVRSLKAKIPDYLQALPGRRKMQIHSKQATSDIKGAVNKSLKLVKEKLDVHMRPFKLANAILYEEYMDARIIADAAATVKAGHTKRDESPLPTMRGQEVWSVD